MDGDECDPQEQEGVSASEPEDLLKFAESFIDLNIPPKHTSILTPEEVLPPYSPSSSIPPLHRDWSCDSSSLDVLAGKDIQSEPLRKRKHFDSTRVPDGTEPHHSGFGKETKKSGSTEGAEPQSASQATEDVQEKHKRVLQPVPDDEKDEEEGSPLRKRFNLLRSVLERISTPLSICSQNMSLENQIINCPESSSTWFDPGEDIKSITTTSFTESLIFKGNPKAEVDSAKVEFEPGAHQTSSETVNSPVTSEDYTDEPLDVEAQGTETCGSPTREQHHPGPVPEDDSSSSSCERSMVSLRSIKLDVWKPEVVTEADGTEEDKDIIQSFSKLSSEKMNLYEAMRYPIRVQLCRLSGSVHPSSHYLPPVSKSDRGDSSLSRASGSGFSRTHVRPPRPHSCPSVTSADINVSTRAVSLPNMKLQSSFQEFTPDFTDDDEDDEVFRFRCSGPGLYQCRETGLVFDMKAEGDVFYRTVPWNRRLLSRHHKKPAGPLFDLTCQQHSVAQLHLPHCEVRSTGGGDHLSVAHIDHDDLELIRPERITETHVVVNVTGFSAFGNVKDEDSPPDQVRALVLLFYKLPAEPDADYLINVLLLPKNVVVRDVLRFRKKLDRGETFLEAPPHCKLQPQQVYSLSTGSGDDSVLVQPTEAEFEQESYDNYLPTFQVVYKTLMKHMKLFLRDSSSTSVWERRVCLSSSGTNRSCRSTRQNHRPDEQLSETRISFIDGVSGPVLQSLLDKLLERKVLSDSEREAAEEERNRRDKAWFVIDTVRRKGDAAGSEMIHYLCELDPFLSGHLGLM